MPRKDIRRHRPTLFFYINYYRLWGEDEPFKPMHLLRRLGVLAGILISPTLIYADPPTHFVLKGNADKPSYVNLKTHSRIYLSDDRFIFASPDGESEEIEFLYSLYHQLTFGNAPSNVNETIGNSPITLRHDSNNTILLTSESDSTMQIGIFSLEGQLKLKGTISTLLPFNIESLPSGCYVAVASDSKTKLSLKFIKR